MLTDKIIDGKDREAALNILLPSWCFRLETGDVILSSSPGSRGKLTEHVLIGGLINVRVGFHEWRQVRES